MLYSASLGGGIARLWRCDNVRIVTSEYAVEEAFENLGDESEPEKRRNALADLLAGGTEIVQHSSTGSLFRSWSLPDPEDVPILQAAIDANCGYLVTGDKKCFGRFFDGPAIDGVVIVRTGEFLRRAEAGLL